MITYEDMPQSAQKAYKLTNNIRKILMFLGWIAFAGWFIAGVYSMIVSKDFAVGELLFMCYMLAGFVPGLVHCEFLFKKLFKSIWMLFLVGFFFLGFIITFALFAGGAFLIADTILFIQKKPLIYSFEHKYFLQTEDAQAEMVVDALSGMGDGASSSDAAKNDLQNLKAMLDQGLITEKEFNDKKKELLERI